jgi:hypothetical protein
MHILFNAVALNRNVTHAVLLTVILKVRVKMFRAFLFLRFLWNRHNVLSIRELAPRIVFIDRLTIFIPFISMTYFFIALSTTRDIKFISLLRVSKYDILRLFPSGFCLNKIILTSLAYIWPKR